LFVSLGLINVRRNLGRSVLAVVSAGAAALIMTSIIALSGGYPAPGYMAARAFMGGDIVIYATPHLVPPETFRQPSDTWSMVQLHPDQMCDLFTLHPELYCHGFLAPGGVAVSPIDLDQLRETLLHNRHCYAFSPAYFLPVRAQYELADEEGNIRLVDVPQLVLRGRDFSAASRDGAWDFARLLTAGRVPGTDEDSAAVGMLDSRLPLLGSSRLPAPGAKITVYVPAIVAAPDGGVYYDYGNETALEIELAGTYETLTSTATWIDEMSVSHAEQLFWVTPQLQVPMGWFESVYAAASNGLSLPPPMQVAVRAEPFSSIENIAAEVAAALPGLTVISVPRQLELSHQRGLPEVALQAPFEMLGRPTTDQVGMPVDLSRTFVALACLIAALLVASNMLFLVAQRRREVGVLKAIGARGRDIGLMILTEALTLSLGGTLIGFGLVRIFATWTMVSNRIPLAEIGRATLHDFALVVSASTAAAALFALIPAWQMARLTSMEVLRNE